MPNSFDVHNTIILIAANKHKIYDAHNELNSRFHIECEWGDFYDVKCNRYFLRDNKNGAKSFLLMPGED